MRDVAKRYNHSLTLSGKWQASSFKGGHGVDSLLSPDTDLYWQSDGPQPHSLSVQFTKKMTIQKVSMYLDYALDESYTPQKIAIKAGNNALDLENVGVLDVNEPRGWVELNLWVDDGQRIPLKTFYMEFQILSNHQNGKDTHVRGIKLHSPPNDEIPFSTLEFQMHSNLR